MRQQLSQMAGITLLLMILVACAPSESAPSTIPATAALISPSPTPETPTDTPRPRGRTKTDQITSQALANNLIGDSATRRFQVYLPPGYETSDDRYPVVFALHGWRGDYEELNMMGSRLNSLIEEGEARPMIIVYPDGGNAFGGSWYRSSPTIGDYESYITRELVDYIDANYRTLPDPESRGITGCSMGGDGAIHLAFKYPDVFSVAAPVSGLYDFDKENDPWWEEGRKAYEGPPDDINMRGTERPIVWFMGGAAIAAPNPDKPPFHLDMPYEIVDGEGQIVPEVYEKITALAPKHEVQDYLDQPIRLRGLMIYHGVNDNLASVEAARYFDEMLTELGVGHEYVEVNHGHCGPDFDYAPVLQFMSDRLAFR